MLSYSLSFISFQGSLIFKRASFLTLASQQVVLHYHKYKGIYNFSWKKSMIKLNCTAKEVWLSIHINSKEKLQQISWWSLCCLIWPYNTSFIGQKAAGLLFLGPQQFVWTQMLCLPQPNHTVKREMVFFRILGLSHCNLGTHSAKWSM